MNQNIIDIYFLFMIYFKDKGIIDQFKIIYKISGSVEYALINSTNSSFVVSDELVQFIESYIQWTNM